MTDSDDPDAAAAPDADAAPDGEAAPDADAGPDADAAPDGEAGPDATAGPDADASPDAEAGGSARPGSRAVLVAGVLAAVIAFCCCGAGAGAFFVRRSVEETGPAQRSVESFVGRLGSGDLDGAYGQLCEPTRKRLDRDEFAATVPARDKLVDVEVTGASVKGSPGTWKATVNADVYDRVGFREAYSFDLVQEDGDWKICGDPF